MTTPLICENCLMEDMVYVRMVPDAERQTDRSLVPSGLFIYCNHCGVIYTAEEITQLNKSDEEKLS